MASPVVPNDFKEVIPDASASLCGNFTKALLQLPVLIYKFIKWMLDDAGDLSDDFTTAISTATVPTGTIITTAVAISNENFLLCDGTLYPVATYPTLGALLGTLYGGSVGVTFGVPDLRGKFVMGVSPSHSLTETGGEEEVTLTQNEVPELGLVSNESGSDGYFGTDSGNGGTGDVGDWTGIGVVNHAAGRVKVMTDGGGAAHENLPPYMALYYYIRV